MSICLYGTIPWRMKKSTRAGCRIKFFNEKLDGKNLANFYHSPNSPNLNGAKVSLRTVALFCLYQWCIDQ